MANKLNTQNNPNSDNWKLSRVDANKMFKLALYDITQLFGKNGESKKDSTFTNRIKITTTTRKENLSSLTNAEFLFPTNPRSINVEEPASITVVALQNGGKYIEHQGSIFKNISISGTTGFRPDLYVYRTLALDYEEKAAAEQAANSAVSNAGQTGTPRLLPTPTIQAPVKAATGFDNFIHLRNMFRAYYDAKQNPDLASKIVMVWGSAKEEDYWIVEPITFRMSRDAGSNRFTYNYEISLRTIQKIDQTTFVSQDDPRRPKSDLIPYKAGIKSLNFFQKMREFINKISNGIRTISGTISQWAEIANRVTSEFLNPFKDLISGATSLVTSGIGTISTIRALINNVVSTVFPVELMREVARLRNTTVNFGNDFTSLFTNPYDDFMNAWKEVIRGTSQTKILVESKDTETYVKLEAAKSSLRQYSNVLNINNRGATTPPTMFSQQQRYNSFKQGLILRGENIQQAAARLTGNPNSYQEIIVHNNLRHPYISEDGDGVQVLRPGDVILIPSMDPPEDTQFLFTNDPNEKISPAEAALGRDIKLTPKKNYGNEIKYGVTFNKNGDLNLISGMDNMKQAINTLFLTEKGELRLHPTYGVKFPIGSKGELQSLIAFKLQTKFALLQDPRIDDVSSINYNFSDGILSVRSNIILKNIPNALTTESVAKI